jgi:hypothetical protein
MAEESANVSLNMMQCPPPEEPFAAYTEVECDTFRDDREHLMFVSFRVRMGKDAFPIRVLLDRRETPDDRLVPEARRRAAVMLRAAVRVLEDGEDPGEAPQSLGGPP